MQKISGQEVSEQIIKALKSRPTPKGILAAIIVGEDPSSMSFVRQKERLAKSLGIDFRTYSLPISLNNDELREEVGRLSKQKSVGGVIVQLPLPERVNKYYVLNAIPPQKDIDVLGERALGGFYNNRSKVLPPSVGTVREIIERLSVKLEENSIAVVGLGDLVGKPIAAWLMNRCPNLGLFSEGSDLSLLSNYDIVISGVGKAGVIDATLLKERAGVIDFGYDYLEGGQVSGDLALGGDGEKSSLKFYTPTPGGTGPILVAKLLENFYKLNTKDNEI